MKYFHYFFSTLAQDMCTVPFTVYTSWRKPPLLNSGHIETILLFMGIKFLLIKNLESGKFFSLPMGINFFLLWKAMLPFCKSNNNNFFHDAKVMTSVNVTITDFYINIIKHIHYSLYKVFTTIDLRDTRNFNIISTAIISNFLIYLSVLQFY